MTLLPLMIYPNTRYRRPSDTLQNIHANAHIDCLQNFGFNDEVEQTRIFGLFPAGTCQSGIAMPVNEDIRADTQVRQNVSTVIALLAPCRGVSSKPDHDRQESAANVHVYRLVQCSCRLIPMLFL